jgi:hypothetical protein
MLLRGRRGIIRLLVPVDDLHGGQHAGVLIVRNQAAVLHVCVHGPDGLDACCIQVYGVRLVQPVTRGLLEERKRSLSPAGAMT